MKARIQRRTLSRVASHAVLSVFIFFVSRTAATSTFKLLQLNPEIRSWKNTTIATKTNMISITMNNGKGTEYETIRWSDKTIPIPKRIKAAIIWMCFAPIFIPMCFIILCAALVKAVLLKISPDNV